MSVGHVARAVEEAGIATVGVYVSAFRYVAEDMSLPRTLVTNHPFGRPVGPPNNPDRHLAVVRAALDIVSHASSGPVLDTMPGRFTD